MKTPTPALYVLLGLTLGACASTGHPAIATGSQDNSRESIAMNSSVSAHREGATLAVRDSMDREPVTFARADRGIPTPQPARDPMGVPTPQPPIPADPHAGMGGNSARW